MGCTSASLTSYGRGPRREPNAQRGHHVWCDRSATLLHQDATRGLLRLLFGRLRFKALAHKPVEAVRQACGRPVGMAGMDEPSQAAARTRAAVLVPGRRPRSVDARTRRGSDPKIDFKCADLYLYPGNRNFCTNLAAISPEIH